MQTMTNVSVEYRRLSEIREDGTLFGIDGFRVNDRYRSALLNNPFRDGHDDVFVKIGLVNGKFGGQEYVFPLNIVVNGKLHLSGSGGCTHVKEWARKSGLGLEFTVLHSDRRDGRFDVISGAGLSQMSLRMQKYFGTKIFEYPRYIMLLKSRAVLEAKLRGVWLKITSLFVDLLILIYSIIIGFFAQIFSHSICVRIVNPGNLQQVNALGRLASETDCRFFELHDARWFGWILTNSFSEYGPAKAYILYKGEDAVGFFMIKKRFHKQASHRGFKNVWLGSVVEWGCMSGYEKKLLWSIIKWALKSRKELDAVEFPVFEPYVQRFLHRLGWRHVGNANCCYRIRTDGEFIEPEGMDNPRNWRIRLGMGDVGLS